MESSHPCISSMAHGPMLRCSKAAGGPPACTDASLLAPAVAVGLLILLTSLLNLAERKRRAEKQNKTKSHYLCGEHLQ